MTRVGPERIIIATVAAAALAVPTLVALASVAAPAGLHQGAALALGAAAVAIVGAALAGVHAAAGGRTPVMWLAALLPAALDGTWRRRRGLALLWATSALLALVQITRLAAFMTDPGLRWGAAFPPVEEGVRHICMSAYVHAADLTRQGDPNIYAERHYPAFDPATVGHARTQISPVRNLGPFIEDAFEYPPPFLLLPRLALLLSNDFLTIRTTWFAVQSVGFMLFAAVLAAAIGGRRGLVAGLLLPALWLALPLPFNFQFGQFHLAAITLAVGGMLAFSRDRAPLGGALLGAAIVSKIFPGLLLVYLAAGRRWRPLAWTAIMGAGYSGLALLVLGPAPFVAFVRYQLPRVASGAAFSFFRRTDLTLASNWGVYGIPFKLERLGLTGLRPETTGPLLAWLFTLALLAVAVIAGRRRLPPAQQPLVWLGLLILGSLRSPLAPNVYTAAPALWLLTLIAGELSGARALTVVGFVLGWLMMGSVPPMPTPGGTIAVWMVGQVIMLSLGFWSVLRWPRLLRDAHAAVGAAPPTSTRRP
jgi:alpha-1,2-mannosyltransferase